MRYRFKLKRLAWLAAAIYFGVAFVGALSRDAYWTALLLASLSWYAAWNYYTELEVRSGTTE